jgi:hypothetical protein
MNICGLEMGISPKKKGFHGDLTPTRMVISW